MLFGHSIYDYILRTLLLFHYPIQYAQLPWLPELLLLKKPTQNLLFCPWRPADSKEMEKSQPWARCVRIEFNTACKT